VTSEGDKLNESLEKLIIWFT